MKSFLKIAAFFILTTAAIQSRTEASIINLDYVDSGWYTQSGSHGASNENYLTGNYCETFNCSYHAEYRSFFVFDLSGISGVINSATLELYNLAYYSYDPSEVLEIVDVLTSITNLRAGGSGHTGTFTDLGTGSIYGSKTVSDLNDRSIVEILLNQSALNDLNTADQLFAFGAHLTTIVGATRPQYVFGGSGNTGSGDLRRLVLDVEETQPVSGVPEPSTILLLGLGGLLGFFRKKFAK